MPLALSDLLDLWAIGALPPAQAVVIADILLDQPDQQASSELVNVSLAGKRADAVVDAMTILTESLPERPELTEEQGLRLVAKAARLTAITDAQVVDFVLSDWPAVVRLQADDFSELGALLLDIDCLTDAMEISRSSQESATFHQELDQAISQISASMRRIPS